MSIKIQSIDFKATDELLEFVNEKVGKLFAMSNEIIRADVALFLESKGKLGGQSKFPRVMPEVMYQEWIHFLCERYQNDTFV